MSTNSRTTWDVEDVVLPKIAQFGLGPIGLATLKLAACKAWAEIVGAIDNDPAKAGRDLGELTGMSRFKGLTIHSSSEELIAHVSPHLIFHTAVSRFRDAFGQIVPIARRGINIVSSCEELVFPTLREPVLAATFDRICRRAGARVVGTGVNPGFVMDVLPVCLASVTREVRAIHVQRVVNASTRRAPLQRKNGQRFGARGVPLFLCPRPRRPRWPAGISCLHRPRLGLEVGKHCRDL